MSLGTSDRSSKEILDAEQSPLPWHVLALVGSITTTEGVRAADWPAYRHDLARSGVTEEPLPARLHLQWVYKAPHPPSPAWPEPGRELNRLPFDYAYELTAAGGAGLLRFFGRSQNLRHRARQRAAAVELLYGRAGPIRPGDPRWAGFRLLGRRSALLPFRERRDPGVAVPRRPEGRKGARQRSDDLALALAQRPWHRRWDVVLCGRHVAQRRRLRLRSRCPARNGPLEERDQRKRLPNAAAPSVGRRDRGGAARLPAGAGRAALSCPPAATSRPRSIATPASFSTTTAGRGAGETVGEEPGTCSPADCCSVGVAISNRMGTSAWVSSSRSRTTAWSPSTPRRASSGETFPESGGRSSTTARSTRRAAAGSTPTISTPGLAAPSPPSAPGGRLRTIGPMP